MKVYKKDGSLTKSELERRRVAALPRPPHEELGAPAQPMHRHEVDIISSKQGECRCCGRRIDSGDEIYWVPECRRKGVARHVVCAVTSAYQRHLDAATEAHREHVISRLEWVRQEVNRDPVLRERLRPKKESRQPATVPQMPLPPASAATIH